MKYAVPRQGRWFEFTDEDLSTMRKEGRKDEADWLMHRLSEKQLNPLAYFLPHGLPWSAEPRVYGDGLVTIPSSEYDRKYKNDGTAFLSDWKNDFQILVAPRKTGKTTHAAGKVGLYACKTNKQWPIFTEHGIEQPEWTGPKLIVVASFGMPNLRDLWNVYREVLPRYELGPYAPNWGKYAGEQGKAKTLSFGDGRPKSIQLAYSESVLFFLAYLQPQHVWESFKSNMLHADEQITKDKLIAWMDGTRTMGDYTPALFSLSGYVLPDRPVDTGSGGFIKRELYDGGNSWGKKVVRYHLDVDSTPDTIISHGKKMELYQRYAGPDSAKSIKDQRKAIARYYPGFEPASGLALDSWDSEVHLISWPWGDQKSPPKNWTKWRVIDYGTKAGINCCIWFAVGPNGHAIAYRSLYERSMEIAETCENIIRLSRNERADDGTVYDPHAMAEFRCFRETQNGEEYYMTLLDSRSGQSHPFGMTIEQLFSRYGVQTSPASTGKDLELLVFVQNWLSVDYSKPHPYKPGQMGASQLYFVETETASVVKELTGLRLDPNENKLARKQDTHAFDCLKWFCADDPKWWGDDEVGEEVFIEQR